MAVVLLPPCTDLTPSQLFAASTVAFSEVPIGAATLGGMNAIKIARRNGTINLSLLLFFSSFFSYQYPCFYWCQVIIKDSIIPNNCNRFYATFCCRLDVGLIIVKACLLYLKINLFSQQHQDLFQKVV